ncbi:hypothetical protein Pmar_PMAR027396 [Perkinsus marinus ATCC 50983]|uniref:Uncharacterized protein n=1 Tax=Perkinsus marinus (strain ATCC 50983 / TXsc) TaxID=423536 RepID=C5KSG4_PERM5|nr:hypothetical protein Pmar_PMAR027396 [Perkinsus marinus ATCC 50983]EER12578.1 hypothetical protein Pmar_PMAR027396 [Perkinsus marinus ATCC 50983]|eukprot:XP_002780783.1 hypothetical protein Pmar_PMAR027396 [Perkinsus marinus ATCC 50983]
MSSSEEPKCRIRGMSAASEDAAVAAAAAAVADEAFPEVSLSHPSSLPGPSVEETQPPPPPVASSQPSHIGTAAGPDLGVDPLFDSPQMMAEVRGTEKALAASAAPVSGEAEGPAPANLPAGLSFNLEATVNILISKIDRLLAIALAGQAARNSASSSHPDAVIPPTDEDLVTIPFAGPPSSSAATSVVAITAAADPLLVVPPSPTFSSSLSETLSPSARSRHPHRRPTASPRTPFTPTELSLMLKLAFAARVRNLRAYRCSDSETAKTIVTQFGSRFWAAIRDCPLGESLSGRSVPTLRNKFNADLRELVEGFPISFSDGVAQSPISGEPTGSVAAAGGDATAAGNVDDRSASSSNSDDGKSISFPQPVPVKRKRVLSESPVPPLSAATKKQRRE